MPAANFNATSAAIAAILVHTLVEHDGEVGLKHGEDGLLISNGVDVSPARTRTEHANHRGFTVVAVSSNPQFRLQFDAKVTVLGGPMSARHPGTGLPLATVRNYYAAIAHQFPENADAWWELMEPSLNQPAGDLSTTRFSLNLWNPAYLTGGVYSYRGNS